jgi:hypothetical protein
VMSLCVSCSSSGGDTESDVFITLGRAHTLKRKKKFAHVIRVVVVMRKVVTTC